MRLNRHRAGGRAPAKSSVTELAGGGVLVRLKCNGAPIGERSTKILNLPGASLSADVWDARCPLCPVLPRPAGPVRCAARLPLQTRNQAPSVFDPGCGPPRRWPVGRARS